MFDVLKKNSLVIFLSFMAILCLYGIISPEHYRIGVFDLYVALKLTFLASVGMTIWYFANVIQKVGWTTLTWLTLGLLIAMQPLFNPIIYPDALLFPFGALLASALISIVVINISQDKRDWIIQCVAWVLLVSGLLTVGTQLLQLFFSHYAFSFIMHIDNRLYGNIAQPNQAGFVLSLAVVSAIYLVYLNYKNKVLLGCLLFAVMILSVGISFSVSRTAVILLFFALMGTLFYQWQSHRIRVMVMIGLSVLAMAGYQFGMVLMSSFFTAYAGKGGVDRLVQDSVGLRPALYDRAFAAFEISPITGIGYGNYLGFGLTNIEQWWWFEHASHSHNVFTQVGAELGVLGLLTLLGVIFVLCKQAVLFVTCKLPQEKYFVCLLLLMFALYSLSEFPLWYIKFLFVFVFLVALIDDGFGFRNVAFNKILAITSLVVSLCSAGYVYVYDYYLQRYEIVMVATVGNQEKIDAYQSTPNIFGFAKYKEEMLHMVADENVNDPQQLIVIGDRLIKTDGHLDTMRVQVRLLMKTNQVGRVDRLHRAMCIIEYQTQTLSKIPHDNCAYTLTDVKRLDPEDKMGYVKRFNEWYAQKFDESKK